MCQQLHLPKLTASFSDLEICIYFLLCQLCVLLEVRQVSNSVTHSGNIKHTLQSLKCAFIIFVFLWKVAQISNIWMWAMPGRTLNVLTQVVNDLTMCSQFLFRGLLEQLVHMPHVNLASHHL